MLFSVLYYLVLMSSFSIDHNEKMNSQVMSHVNGLVSAIESAMSPTTSYETREECENLCQQFMTQASASDCRDVGFQLIASFPPACHFGLSLVEHCIKVHWQALLPQERQIIKVGYWFNHICVYLYLNTKFPPLCAHVISVQDQVIWLMNAGNGPLPNLNASHLKDGISRLMVEIVKQEGPHQVRCIL